MRSVLEGKQVQGKYMRINLSNKIMQTEQPINFDIFK